MKIQIKHKYVEHVLFEHEQEGNTLKLTVEEAARQKVHLLGAKLSGADLRGANLEGVTLYDADLSRADLSGANLRQVNFYGAHLWMAELSGADLRGSDLSHAHLNGIDAIKTNFSGASFSCTNCHYADFSGADLSETRFYNVIVTGVKTDSETRLPDGYTQSLTKISQQTKMKYVVKKQTRTVDLYTVEAESVAQAKEFVLEGKGSLTHSSSNEEVDVVTQQEPGEGGISVDYSGGRAVFGGGVGLQRL